MKIYKILYKILNKKFNFNESIDLYYCFNFKKKFFVKNFLILPHKTKKKNIISFVQKENYILSKEIIGEKNTFLEIQNLKEFYKFKYFFFDSLSYLNSKKKLSYLYKKKKKIDFDYGNVSNDFNNLKLLNIGKLKFFNLSNNFCINIGCINMKIDKIYSNFSFVQKYILNLIYSYGYTKKNFLSLYIKSTQGKSYKL